MGQKKQLKKLFQRVAKLQNRRFFPEDTFVHGHLPDRTREAVDSEKLRAVSREVRCQEFIFSVSD